VMLVCNVCGAGALELARAHDIPHALIDHTAFDSRAAFDAAVVERLRQVGAQWVVMAGWMRIVTPTFIAAFPERILNIHPSLLPSFRGMHAVRQALRVGVKIAGCTVHLVGEDVDDGPIIAQSAVPVLSGDDEDTLHARIQQSEHALYPMAIAQAISDARRRTQDH
ncbi:MAG: phosphoribosylglycinamide formyltransferase, partial [Myxococcota bacterium]